MKQLFLHSRKTSGSRAQAMVEFAIVAPILFLLLFGIIEAGRMVFYYAAASNASREAVRYGSAIGYDDLGELKYRHCAAIRDIVRRSSLITIPDADIVIQYDRGPDPLTGTVPTPYHTCTGTVDPGYFVKSGDRIKVTVTARYKPYTKLTPWGSRNFTSTSYRTILGFITIVSTPNGSGGGGTSTATATSTPTDPANPPTDTPTATATGTPPTSTPTDTPTATPAGYTPLPTSTPTDATPTSTPTDTPTATPTYTPTSTPTAVPGCEIQGGPITIQSNYMAMTFTNPHVPVLVSSVRVIWNTSSGAPSQRALNLKSASLGSLFWTGTESGGDVTIAPSDVIIPGNNAESTIFFTFDDFYDHSNGNESITITYSAPGCENFIIQSTPPTLTATPTPTSTP